MQFRFSTEHHGAELPDDPKGHVNRRRNSGANIVYRRTVASCLSSWRLLLNRRLRVAD